jgi:signal transduction histidine kinase/CheY-like chemotaxis protein
LTEHNELDGVFDRPVFSRFGDIEVTRIHNGEHRVSKFLERVERDVTELALDLALVEAEKASDRLLTTLRDASPALPVLLIVRPEDVGRAVEAFRYGIDGYVVRTEDESTFRDLLTEQVNHLLERNLDPPSTPRPVPSELLRYAHYFNVLHPFLVFDINRRLRFVNQAAREFMRDAINDSAEMTVGERLENLPLNGIEPQLSEGFRRAMRGDDVIHERRFEGIQAGSALREVYCQPVIGEGGRVVAVSVAIYLPMHPELREARRHAALGRLAASVAHDFNNLLSVIATASELIHRRPDSNAEAHFEMIERSVHKGEKLTRSLLSYAGRGPGKAEVVSLPDLLESNGEFVRRMLGDDIELKMDVAEHTPETEADPDQLEQVLLNLVANARAAMPGGGTLRVSTTARHISPDEPPPAAEIRPGRYVEWCIEDTGRGMTEDELDQAFDPYFSTRGGKGNGLGLATVQGIVESAHGAVAIESEPGEGTTVSIFLPAVPSAKSPDSESTRSSEEPDQPVVLVVEDQPELRVTIVQLLEDLPWETAAAESAEEALDIAEQLKRIDLLISDIMLPGDNGLQLVERLEQDHPDMKIILMSGYSDEETVGSVERRSERSRFVRKPFDPAELTERVEKMLAKPTQGRNQTA